MLCARYKRCAIATFCCAVLAITQSFGTASPWLQNASIEFEAVRGLRNATIEFAQLRGLRSATIEFDLFDEGRRIEVLPDALDFGVVRLGISTTGAASSATPDRGEPPKKSLTKRARSNSRICCGVASTGRPGKSTSSFQASSPPSKM